VVQQPSRDACVNIAINAVIGGLIPNYMWNIAFALTTPLMVAIGLSFSTPLGVAAGYIKSGVVKTESAIAAFIIILSFCLLNLASLNEPLDAEIDEKVLKVLSSNSKASKNDSES
jgi:drug/metabolite transporter (DMT)-like permease